MSLSSADSGAFRTRGACRGGCKANRHIVPEPHKSPQRGCVAWQFPAGCLYQITCPCRRPKHGVLVLFGYSSLQTDTTIPNSLLEKLLEIINESICLLKNKWYSVHRWGEIYLGGEKEFRTLSMATSTMSGLHTNIGAKTGC